MQLPVNQRSPLNSPRAAPAVASARNRQNALQGTNNLTSPG